MLFLRKAHPVQQAMSAAARPADLVDGEIRRNPGEPSREQAEADAYKKPRVQWRGLTIAIENPAGSVRRGTNRHGVSWEIRMRYDYGEVVGSMGVDGDPVDIYLGPNLEAPMVYVVHQRRVNDWENYDEDKCMVGFDSEEDATQAFLSNYTDPRFLGPITAMPVDEFVAKVRATKEKPAMIKAILFFKGHVGPYLRGGRMVNMRGYQGRSARAVAGPGQGELFANEHGEPTDSAHAEGDNWVMPIKDAIKEHKELVRQEEHPTSANRAEEEKEQGGELKRMEAAEKKRDPKADYKAAVTSAKEGPSDDNPRRKYYVTIAREGRGVAKLAGPFDTHDEAKGNVERARKMAEELDPRAAFDAFGTSGIEADEHKPGVLNERLGIGEKMTKAIPILFIKSDKLSDSMRERIGSVGSKKRQDEPEDVFLEPGQRKYPVKIRQGGQWAYSPKLLEAAAARARMEGREDIAKRADEIRSGL